MRMQIARAVGLSICGLLGVVAFGSVAPHPVAAQTVAGTIAYMRDNDTSGDEIWLIEPDGSNNRRIWSTGQADPSFGDPFRITDLDWSLDASAIAFSSQHEQACSIYESDIYTIQPDGSGYRRITSSPACAALASYPKGNVTVTVRNFTTLGPLYVYVQGAPMAQYVPAGSSTTVTVANVADFGDGVLQQAVVIDGPDRWVAPIALADVKPGQTVHAGRLDVSGNGIENLGAYTPSWHRNGTRLGFISNGCGGMAQIAAHPQTNETGTYLLQAQNVFACVLDWGPTPALANQLLYWIQVKDGVGDGGIYRVTEGSTNRGTELVDTGIEGVIDVQWLPDGSGFLFTKGNYIDHANVYRYDFASGRVTQLTTFTSEFAIDVSVSPDGQWIVFERAATQNLTAGDLWLMRRDGTNMRRLVQNGMRPSWSQRAPQMPKKILLPLARR
jgi:hypothetical protein